MVKWIRNHAEKISVFDVAEIFRNSYERVATMAHAAGGFRGSGIWPMNRHVFREEDFIAGKNLSKKNRTVTSLELEDSDNPDDPDSVQDPIPVCEIEVKKSCLKVRFERSKLYMLIRYTDSL